MIIKILGVGCRKCEKLFEKVNDLVKSNNLDAEVLKIEDINEFMKYGILLTPALIINEKLKCSINIPTEKQILKYINEEL